MNAAVTVPVLPVTAVDRVVRDVTAAGLLCDLPGAVVLQHDLDADGVLHRTVHDLGGVRERERLELDHGCLSCALREDVLPALHRLTAGTERPSAIVLALPVSAEALPVERGLRLDGGAAAVAAVVAAVDPAALEWDLFGDDLLDERGLALAEDDRRAVGEALAHQLEFADVVAVGGDAPLTRRTTAVLAHLVRRRPDLRPVDALLPADLVRTRRAADDDRGDPRVPRHTGAADAGGVWTLDLHSWRPFHPDRLLDRIEGLGSGRLRGRGRFWLPTRPETVGVWDGAGGQLSLGSLGTWGAKAADTRLVVTGLGEDPTRVREAFEASLLTDAELSRGLARWAGRDDGFDPWLGERRLSA